MPNEKQKIKSRHTKRSKENGVSLRKSKKSDKYSDWDEKDLEIVIVDEEEDDDDLPIHKSHHSKHKLKEDDEDDNYSLSGLPDHVLISIISHLDDKDVFNLSATNRDMSSFIWQHDIWDDRIMSLPHHMTDAKIITSSHHLNKMDIIDLYKKNHTTEQRLIITQKTAKEDRLRERRSKVGTFILELFFFNRSADYFSLFCIMLSTWLIIFKLDENISIPWRVILVPFAFPLIILNGALILFDCLKWRYYELVEKPGQKLAFWRQALVRRRKRLLVYIITACLNLTYIFTMILMNETTDGIHVAAVFTPLIVICVAISITFTGYAPEEFNGLDIALIILTNLIFTLQFIFAILKIEGNVKWSWLNTLIPTWVLCSLIVFLPIILSCLSCCMGCVSDSYTFQKPGAILLLILLTSIVVLIPLLAFLGMMTNHLDGKNSFRSWLLMSAPIIFLECAALVLCTYIDIAVVLCA